MGTRRLTVQHPVHNSFGGLAKIAAAREIGIVFSVVLGMLVLRERWL
ncbi:MAG: hypothetical protein HY696_10040 [Deltaproteobacteria bacterium]|nr:hypothetical protein [Deltaproteobacteria bacterium]